MAYTGAVPWYRVKTVHAFGHRPSKQLAHLYPLQQKLRPEPRTLCQYMMPGGIIV